MNRQSLILAAATGGVLTAAGLLVWLGRPGTEPDTAAMRSADRLATLEKQLAEDAVSRRALAASMVELTGRLERLEERRRAPVPAPARAGAGEPTAVAEPAAATVESAIEPAVFTALMTDVLRSSRDGMASTEDQERFWQAARTTPMVDDTIAALEARVGASPADGEARMQLADAYVAKLLTVPAGPERGIWGVKAESQWQSVVDSDPNHWDAQYSLAYNWSMYPEFLNRTDDAIAGFEQALEIQSRVAPQPTHAKTYVHLARMWGVKGDAAKAREVLELGRARHPRDPEIAKSLESLVGK